MTDELRFPVLALVPLRCLFTKHRTANAAIAITHIPPTTPPTIGPILEELFFFVGFRSDCVISRVSNEASNRQDRVVFMSLEMTNRFVR